jgi:glycosyltransferase involved in cell wall biosynthesis/GT2 family glycosyltransferase
VVKRPPRRWSNEDHHALKVVAALLRRVGLRRGPIAYRQGEAGPATVAGPIDVIVPVYGAAADFRRCLASVVETTDLARHRLVVVLDGPGQIEAVQALEPVARQVGDGLLVLENPTRRGFAASVNRGMAASRRDVVLLNSDTEVTERWLEKLQQAAYSAAEIATVTPFSNNATICSLPRLGAVNAIPTGHTVESFARLVERSSAREYPRIPTGVGVCLYIKRAVLDAVGVFDETAFGLGYGEESDFCMRALAAGFVHVLDDATFIYHAGQRSFGAARGSRVRAAERSMRRRHPAYRATIAQFMREDPLREARGRVGRALDGGRAGERTTCVLHVVHGWPPFNHAGTETYARGLALRQGRQRDVVVYARIAQGDRSLGETTELIDHGVRVRLAVNNFTQRNPFSRNALRCPPLEADFARLVDEVRPDLVHVHHLAGHGVGLLRAVTRRRIPYVYQVQDWWALCARSNLLPPSRQLCAGPNPAKCARCLPLTGLPPAGLLNRLLYRYRARATKRALRGADAIVVGSRFIAASHRDFGYLPPRARIDVVPYGVVGGRQRPLARPTPPSLPLRFGLIGSIMPHKGIHVAVEAFREVAPERATLEVWGDPSNLPAYVAELRDRGSAAVRFNEPFAEERKAEVFARIDVLLVPSLGLESFGLVVREAMAHGVPVLASRRGALLEAFEDGQGGAFFEPGDARALRDWVERLCRRPETIVEWRRRMPTIKGMDEHVEEIDAIYADVLARRKGRV